MSDWFHQYTRCSACGAMAFCSSEHRATVRCPRCISENARLAPAEEAQREFDADMLAWVRAGTPRDDLPCPAACNRRVLARIDAEREARALRQRERRRQQAEARKAELAERNARIVADLHSGRFLEAEVAAEHGLTVDYVRRIEAAA
jgi:hypothetical protein